MIDAEPMYPLDFSATVPAGTDETDPHTVVREFDRPARLSGARVRFPAGITSGDVGVALALNQGEQVAPRDAESDFFDRGVDWSMSLPLDRAVRDGERLVARFVNSSGGPVDVPVVVGYRIDNSNVPP